MIVIYWIVIFTSFLVSLSEISRSIKGMDVRKGKREEKKRKNI